MDKELKKILEKFEDPNYQEEINFALPENSTHEQKIKYKICQKILRYQRINKLTDREITETIGLNLNETKNVLYCHIDEFTLDQLENCISRLPILSFETPIIKENNSYPLWSIPSLLK